MSASMTTFRNVLLVSACAVTLAACSGGGVTGDGGDNGDNNGAESAPTVSLGGTEENFQYSCITDPEQPEVLIIAAIGTDVDSLAASLGEGADDDFVQVDIDDTYWEASSSNGEITSLNVDIEAGYASGEATFVSPDTGATEEGTFAFSCS